MTDAVERNRKLFDGLFGATYSRYMERERLSRVIARLIWASDVRPYYASMQVLADLPDGSTVVDCPCGAGVALRALRPEQRVRYLGFDLAPAMLVRARTRANSRHLPDAVFAKAEATRLPLVEGEVDLFLSYFGLHCFEHPEEALHEAARSLRPDGRLVGSTIVRGDRPLDRLRVRPGVGGFGAVGDESAVRRWLGSAGFADVAIQTHGVFASFSAVKPGQPSPAA